VEAGAGAAQGGDRHRALGGGVGDPLSGEFILLVVVVVVVGLRAASLPPLTSPAPPTRFSPSPCRPVLPSESPSHAPLALPLAPPACT
jgi:hypothetical protein